MSSTHTHTHTYICEYEFCNIFAWVKRKHNELTTSPRDVSTKTKNILYNFFTTTIARVCMFCAKDMKSISALIAVHTSTFMYLCKCVCVYHVCTVWHFTCHSRYTFSKSLRCVCYDSVFAAGSTHTSSHIYIHL